ncbi:MAG: hypothetical protein FJ098_12460 [Deltaproteobacteria bacterium]|nr:hypothetical protein [Deltaproteobacteria bacterium]
MTRLLLLLFVLGLAACGGGTGPAASDVATDTGADPAPDGLDDVRDPTEIRTPGADTLPDLPPEVPPGPARYGRPELDSEPLYDYIQRVVTDRGLSPAEFDHSLKELAVFQDRLYLGYGDWTVNTGPVDIRHFEADGRLVVDVVIDEESIDYYRVEGTRMFIPGVDPRQPPGTDPLTGNVFTLEAGGQWVSAHELEQCLHVLDTVPWGDALWACGSGNIDMDHYHAGDDMAVLWRSDDGGLTWDVETTWHDDNTNAVVRWERFLRAGGDLYVLGQTIDYVAGVLTNVPRKRQGEEWVPVDLLPTLWVRHTLQWRSDEGLVWGLDLGAEGKPVRVFRVGAQGVAESVAYLDAEDLGVLDVFRLEDEDLVFLVREGSSTDTPPAAPWAYRVLRTHDLDAFDELTAFEHGEAFLSVALWGDRLLLGGVEGGLWECPLLP